MQDVLLLFEGRNSNDQGRVIHLFILFTLCLILTNYKADTRR